jgi:hypothetical protein
MAATAKRESTSMRIGVTILFLILSSWSVLVDVRPTGVAPCGSSLLLTLGNCDKHLYTLAILRGQVFLARSLAKPLAGEIDPPCASVCSFKFLAGGDYEGW